MTVRVKFEPIIGGVLYDHVDAEFTILGFDEDGVERWREKLNYAGPEANDFKIKSGLHRYAMEVNKWGMVSQQQFLGSYLWDSRVKDGAVPTTFVFTGEAEPRKLDYMVSYVQTDGTSDPQSKTVFRYDNIDRVESITTYRYTSSTRAFVKDSERYFEYEKNRVKKIETFSPQAGTPYETINYTYDDGGLPTRIVVKSTRSGITTNVGITWPENSPTVSVVYQSSNGQGFEYTFIRIRNTIGTDKTTRSTQVCSEGGYTYDRNINPLSHLGYIDYLFRNYSAYNRITEAVTYTGCAFPTLVAESYSYAYDDEGYPTKAKTHYTSKTVTTEVRYFYRNN